MATDAVIRLRMLDPPVTVRGIRRPVELGLKFLTHRYVIDAFEEALEGRDAFNNHIDVLSQRFAVRPGLDNQVSLATERQRDDVGSRRLGQHATDCCDSRSVMAC